MKMEQILDKIILETKKSYKLSKIFTFHSFFLGLVIFHRRAGNQHDNTYAQGEIQRQFLVLTIKFQ